MLRDEPSRKQIGPPIDRYRRNILFSLQNRRVLIIAGETGSGKSTRVPCMLYEAGIFNGPRGNNDNGSKKQHQMIGVTQPRRIAAIQLAHRVAQDLRCNLGSTVGYAVRFKERISETETMIKFMTEGLLLREMLTDPKLSEYSVIIVDEVHERNLNTDILLGLLKCLMVNRNDLKIVVCSATLDLKSISEFFQFTQHDIGPPAVLTVDGKMFPVKIYYRFQPVPNYLDYCVETVVNIHESNRLASGKILIFLTGQDEVEYVCERLKDYADVSSNRLDLKKLMVLPLHGSLRHEDISKAFDEHGRDTRVCIVSTNVAETSLTIDGIAFVVDCGFCKLKVYNHKTGIDSLIRVPISKSSARQRAGRAGRTRAGVVYRLYPEDEFEKLEDSTLPEIQRSSLTEAVMMLKSLGVQNPQKFPLISQMPRENLVDALECLYALQAIDEFGNLTSQGEIMASLNLDPKIAKILVSLEAAGCTIECCKIAAMLQVKELFVKSNRFCQDLWSNTSLNKICVSEGDMPSYLNILNSFIASGHSQKWAERRNLNYQALMNALEIFKKLEMQLKKNHIRPTSCGNLEKIQRSLVSGLFSNAAYLHANGDYRTIKGDEIVHIHPNSVFSELVERPKHVVFVEILSTSKTYMRHIMAIEPNWLLEAAPHYYSFGTSSEVMTNKRPDFPR